MSTVNIKLLSPVVITKPNASKAYKQMVVTHTDGKDTTGKKIFDFTTPKHVWDTLAAAKQDDTFLITREKNDKGYWEWKDIGAATAAPVATTPTTTATPSATVPAKVGNWETTDERAAKQRYIVRQSSITAALGFANLDPNNAANLNSSDIVRMAQYFENYVFTGSDKPVGVAGLTDDQPE